MELRHICGGPPAVILDKSASAMDVIAAMVENEVSSVILNRADLNDAYGFITITDIINDVIAYGLDPTIVKADDISSKPLISTNNLDLDIRWIAKKMANEGVSQLAVFDAGELKCIVSDIDLLKAVANELKEKPARKGGRKK
ncbi:MAG: CBS domain-containing protein [Thermoplasmata archaeon]